MIKIGQHLWYSPWNTIDAQYCVVLEIAEQIKIRLVDKSELWVPEFELSEDFSDE